MSSLPASLRRAILDCLERYETRGLPDPTHYQLLQECLAGRTIEEWRREFGETYDDFLAAKKRKPQHLRPQLRLVYSRD